MEHIIHLMINPFVIALFLVLIFHHRLPVEIFRFLGSCIFWILWFPIVKLDYSFFPDNKESIAEIKKRKFLKIISPFVRFFLLFIAFVLYIGDNIFNYLVVPIMKKIDFIFEHDRFKKIILWVEGQNIIVLRIFIGIPFLLMEIVGIYAGFLFSIGDPLAIIVYLSKIIWIIPFKFFNKVGHAKFDNDPWYLGLKQIIINVKNAVNDLGAYKTIHNKIILMKNFINDSHYNAKLEIKIRKQIISKSIHEIFTLRHLSDNLNLDDKIDLIILSPNMIILMEKLSNNTATEVDKKEILDYLESEFKSNLKKE